MSDTQQHLWTPGPWCVQRQGDHVGAVWTGTDPETHGNPLAEVHRRRGGMGSTDWLAGSAYMRLADADLVALAPEMAEAILQLADPQEHVIEDHIVHITSPVAVVELAEKLRAIGEVHHG